MAQNYTRQSSFADGDTITAALFNNEFNQVVNAFAYSASSDGSTGHKHDGTSGQGGNIPQIGDIDFLNKIVVDNTNNRWGFYVQVSGGTVEQLRIQDGAIVPVTNNDIDLGTSSLEFKDLFLDGTAHIDTLDVDVNATVAGTLGVTGATTLSSTLGVTGAITGSSTLQATTITATTAFVPDASDGASLGTTSLEFSDLFLADGALIAFGNDQDVTITHLADAGLLLNGARGLFFNDTTQYINAPNGTTLDIAATDEIELNATLIDINGAVDISGNLDVGGNLVVTGTTTFNGGTLTMGDAATDNVVFGADINSNIIPNTDDTYDLGSSSQEWRNLYIDGTANIDSLVADTADINGGTIDSAVIGGTTPAAITGTAITATGIMTATGTSVFASLDISGDIDVDGTTNLDVVDIDGAVDMATTLTVAGNVDFNGDLDVDGTTNLDVVDIGGAVTVTGNLINFNTGAGNAPYIQHTGNQLDIRGGTGSTRFLNNAGSQSTVTIRDTGNVNGSGLDVTGSVTADGLTVEAASGNSTITLKDASGSPNISFTDVTDTVQWQIYSTMGGVAGLDPLIFYSSAGERLRIDTSGNVGIGETSPSTYGKLVVTGSTPFAVLRSSDVTTAGFSMLVNSGSNGVGSIATDNGGHMTFDTGSTGASQAERMRIDASGNVSIGTSNSLGVLTIKAPASDDEDIITITEDGINQAFSINGNFAGSGSTGNAITLDSYWADDIISFRGDGNVGIGSGNPQNKLDIEQSAAVSARLLATGATSSSLKLEVKGGATQLTTTEILANSSGAMTFATGTTSSAERMRLDASGNVGIGGGS